MKKTYFISSTTFCMERMLDAQKISNYLKVNGWSHVKDFKRAELIIISACAFGKNADENTLDYLHYFSTKRSSSAKIVVAGCIPQIASTFKNQLNNFYTISPTDFSMLDEIIDPKIAFKDSSDPNVINPDEVTYNLFFKKWLKFLSIPRNSSKFSIFKKGLLKNVYLNIKDKLLYLFTIQSFINPFLTINRNKFCYIRISLGCLGACSYCSKRFYSGKLQSKGFENILNEFKSGLKQGYKNFYLLTEDAGCYGLDINTNIVNLLQRLFESGKDYDFKIVLSNINAQWFIKFYDELLPIFVNNQSKINYVHIPVESGSNRILKLMNRPYSIEDVKEKLLSLKISAPSLSLVTDIIVGFPQENEADFLETKEFLKTIQFDHVDIFGYENRPNTRASEFEGHIPNEIIRKRTFVLAKQQNSINKRKPLKNKIIQVIEENVQSNSFLNNFKYN